MSGHFISTLDQRRYSLDQPRWCGPEGELLDICFRPRLDRKAIARGRHDMWRYRPALPLAETTAAVTLGEGSTPLTAAELAGTPVWLKQEQLQPTGSFKDRGAAVLLTKARELGVTAVVEDSSGNAGAAVAAYAARAAIRCTIFAPAGTSAAKLRQIRAYGARLKLVDGDREASAQAAQDAAATSYYASHVWNPFFLHGIKTLAYEMCEQLAWRAPELVILPVGNGSLLLGAALGFNDLHAAGLIGRLPRLIGVQPAACAPLVTAFDAGHSEPAAVTARATLAEGAAIDRPRRGAQILAAIRACGGQMLAVSEAEIAAAQRALAAAGFYVEPTAALAPAAVARLRAAAGSWSSDAGLVVVLTGHGLKSVARAGSEPV